MTSERIAVRRAETGDIEWVIGELRDLEKFADTKYSLMPSDEVCREGLGKLIDQHFVAVAERARERLGFIAGILIPHLMNPDLVVLHEVLWWVPPRFRKTGAGAALLDAFVHAGKGAADWIMFALQHHSPVDERCLLKRGFRLQERQYLLET